MDGLNVKKETFVNADEDTRKAMTFDLLKGIYDMLGQHLEICDKRHEALDDKRRKNLAYAVMSGGVGGFLAGLGKSILSFFGR